MSGPNPFDDVGRKPSGGNPRGSLQASLEVDREASRLDAQIDEAFGESMPTLIMGEAYSALEHQSVERTQQDFLDDKRFEDESSMTLKFLSSHEERERAARAMARRDPDISEQVVPVLVSDAEKEIREGRKGTATWTFVILVTLYFAGDSLVQGQSVIAALVIGVVSFFGAFLLLLVLGNIWHMGEARGRAI
jgi:hypothetical protein